MITYGRAASYESAHVPATLPVALGVSRRSDGADHGERDGRPELALPVSLPALAFGMHLKYQSCRIKCQLVLFGVFFWPSSSRVDLWKHGPEPPQLCGPAEGAEVHLFQINVWLMECWNLSDRCRGEHCRGAMSFSISTVMWYRLSLSTA